MVTTAANPESPPRRAKYPAIAELISRRIRRGDYVLGKLPSERKLAGQLGVSYMTARKAVQKLVEDGQLARGETGRLLVPEQSEHHKKLNIAIVLHDLESSSQIIWRSALQQVLDEQGDTLRTVTYAHKDDPRLLEVLDADFDGIFLLPPPEPAPLLLDKLRQNRHRLVTIWHDLSEHGIPCVNADNPSGIVKLIEYLAALGYTRVDCLNAKERIPVMENRIRGWREGLVNAGITGRLHSDEVSAFEWGDKKAHQIMSQMLESDSLHADALFCTTTTAAVGVNRAAYEHGLRVGADLALCGMGDTNKAQMCTPSLTIVDTPDPAPYLRIGLKWLHTGGRGWDRPLKIGPGDEDMKLLIGESTEPSKQSCPNATVAPEINSHRSGRGSESFSKQDALLQEA